MGNHYSLNLHGVICQLYLSKAEKKISFVISLLRNNLLATF